VWWRDPPEEDEREDAHGAVVPDVEDEQRALPEEQNDGVEELVVLRKRTLMEEVTVSIPITSATQSFA
jgi:hypothetical protein